MAVAKTWFFITILFVLYPKFVTAEETQRLPPQSQDKPQKKSERKQRLQLTPKNNSPDQSTNPPLITEPEPGIPQIREELQQIKERVNSIERDIDRRPIFSEEGSETDQVYPLQTSAKTLITGGMTMIAQGVLNNEARFGGDRADGSLSIDLILESEIRDSGLLIIRGDFMRGEGLQTLPPLAAGVNADIETFTISHESFHLIEALYEQSWKSNSYRFSFGQIDTTSYFDQNTFANSETFQFISPLFGNNPVINWGGDENGYGPGFVFHVHPVEVLELNLGLFEGDGNYNNMFDQPFIILEVELESYRGDLEGHYRLMFWSNETNRTEILNPAITASHNRGFAISFDQDLNKQYGIWGRFGVQDGKVSTFDRHVSLGLHFHAPLDRNQDTAGIAVSGTWLSGEYTQKTGLDKTEYVTEVFYNIALGSGIHLSPDIQYIANPGGDGKIDPITVYGLRAQLIF